MSEAQLEAQLPGRAFRQGFVEVAGAQIGYWEAGSGPALVMLPGSAGLDFSIAMDLLTRHFRVLAMDPPGWGNASDQGRVMTREDASDQGRVMTREALAEQMAGAVAALGVERYALVGTSMGGSVALFMALQHPERVSAAVLDGPIEFRGNGHTRPRDPRAMAGFRRHADRRPWATKAFLEDQYRRRVRRFESGYETGPEYDQDLAERCKTLETPVLVLYGSDDGVILPSCGREYKALIPNCDFIIVYDSNHDIQADRPEAYAELVTDFLLRGSPAFLFNARSGVLNR
jgi:pimeloyl-ACP methyl ester carboxylesterase